MKPTSFNESSSFVEILFNNSNDRNSESGLLAEMSLLKPIITSLST